MSQHVVPRTTYYTVFAALLALLVLTVAAAGVDLGPAGPVVALSIAVAKATLIVLYFMHVRYAVPLMRVFACAGFLWLLILFALTMSDYLTRGGS